MSTQWHDIFPKNEGVLTGRASGP